MQHHYEGHWKGWDLKIETFLGPEMARAKGVPFGPKKVETYKIITYRAIKTTGTLMVIMYLRPILCTLYGAVDFLNVLKKGWWWGVGGVLLVHSEIYYVPIGDGWEWEEVLNFFGPKWHSLRSCHFRAQKSLNFQSPPLPMPLVMMLHPSKPLHTAP